MWDLLEPRGFSTYREAASISRVARSKGITLKTIDTLIAAIALEHHASLFSLDKDFSRIARITPLQFVSYAWIDTQVRSDSIASTPAVVFLSPSPLIQ